MRTFPCPVPFLLLAGLALQFGCQGKGGSAAAPAAARVTALTASPAQVGFGQPSTLAWTLSGAPGTLLLADDLSGAAPRDVSGLADLLVNPVRRQTFTLMAGTDPAAAAADPNPVRVTVAAKGLDLLAGSSGGPGNLDGLGPQARFYRPQGVAVDRAGTVFVADMVNCTIRRIDPDGLVTTLAGKAGEAGFQDGLGGAARFAYPYGLVVDAGGNLLISDSGNNVIRRLSADGTVTTLAGDPGVRDTVDGTGREAGFSGPVGLALDPAGNLFVAESGGDCIRKVTPAGVVSTFAGQPGIPGYQDGPGAQALFSGPKALAFDAAGNLWVAESYVPVIRRISPAGVVSTAAGNLEVFGSQDGPAREATFSPVEGLAADASGAVYVSGGDKLVRRIGADGIVTTVAGTANQAGTQDGVGADARFTYPAGLALDPAGNLIIADSAGNSIRRLEPSGRVRTLAGSGMVDGYADATGPAARFGVITAAAVDAAGNTYVADFGNKLVRRITPAGLTSTVAGTQEGFGYQDGPAAQAQLGLITAMAVGRDGSIYMADLIGPSIRVISAQGQVSTLAGPSQSTFYGSGLVDGTGAAARFWRPTGLAVDDAGNLYVADRTAVRKVTPAGVVTTLAGTADPDYVDGTGGTARFQYLAGLARDAQGNLFVTDVGTVRRIDPAGVVSTLAGSAEAGSGYADGSGADARFNDPSGLSADAQGNLYVADYGNDVIRKVTPAGVVTTVAGQARKVGLGIGPLPGSLAKISDVRVTPAGDLLVIQNNCVAQVTLPD